MRCFTWNLEFISQFLASNLPPNPMKFDLYDNFGNSKAFDTESFEIIGEFIGFLHQLVPTLLLPQQLYFCNKETCIMETFLLAILKAQCI